MRNVIGRIVLWIRFIVLTFDVCRWRGEIRFEIYRVRVYFGEFFLLLGG